jgi:hypothetical protein
MSQRQQSTSEPEGERPRSETQPIAAENSLVAFTTSLTFRTLAGSQTIHVRRNETNEIALARHFGVDIRRIVLQMLNGESCVSVLDPFEIYHDACSPEFRCPPGFMELYRQNLNKVDWSALSGNPGAFDLLAEHLDRVNWNVFSLNSNRGAIAFWSANLFNGIIGKGSP